MCIRDSFQLKNPNPGEPEGTFHGFKGSVGGARIDWIGATAKFTIESATIDRTKFDGRYPSDHFPVTAVLK